MENNLTRLQTIVGRQLGIDSVKVKPNALLNHSENFIRTKEYLSDI